MRDTIDLSDEPPRFTHETNLTDELHFSLLDLSRQFCLRAFGILLFAFSCVLLRQIRRKEEKKSKFGSPECKIIQSCSPQFYKVNVCVVCLQNIPLARIFIFQETLVVPLDPLNLMKYLAFLISLSTTCDISA